MKKIMIISIITVLNLGLYAQNDTLRLSLEQSVRMGLSNRYDVKAGNLNVEIAKSESTKSGDELLPDLSLNGKGTYYNDVQPSIIPAGYLGFTEPQKITIGMKNNTVFSLDLTYPVFRPGLYTDLKIAGNNLKLAGEKQNEQNLNVRLQIAEAYYNVLLNSLQVQIGRENEARYGEYYALEKGRAGLGVVTESEVLQAELDYDNARSATEILQQKLSLSLSNLRYRTNVPGQTVIILTDSLQEIENSQPALITDQDTYRSRSDLKELLIEQDGIQLQMKKARQNFLPSLSLFADYTQLFQGSGFGYSNTFFWSPVDYVGLRFSVPLTGNLKNSHIYREFRIKQSQTDYYLNQKTADIQYEIQSATTRLADAGKNLRIARDTYALSKKLYLLKKQEFTFGSFSYDHLLDTEKSLSNAEQGYISAVYELLLSDLNYHRALGVY